MPNDRPSEDPTIPASNPPTPPEPLIPELKALERERTANKFRKAQLKAAIDSNPEPTN